MDHDIKMDFRPKCEAVRWFWTGLSGVKQLTILFVFGVNLFGDYNKNPVQPLATINKFAVNVLEARRSGILRL